MELVVKKFEELTTEELYELLKIRVEVFVVEQKCPYQEIDEKDKNAYHIYLKEAGQIKAYLRVLYPGILFEEASIGRVLTTERGKGYANIILREGINIAREKLKVNKIKIEAHMLKRCMKNLDSNKHQKNF